MNPVHTDNDDDHDRFVNKTWSELTRSRDSLPISAFRDTTCTSAAVVFSGHDMFKEPTPLQVGFFLLDLLQLKDIRFAIYPYLEGEQIDS